MARQCPEIEEFTIGWICALHIELTAATGLLDERYRTRQHAQYILGRIGHHNVAIVCCPAGQLGTSSAAITASELYHTFPNIQYSLLVGIGGGVPSREADIRLGDVVISHPYGQYGGVVQYDFGKAGEGGLLTRTGFLNAPSPALLTAVANMRSENNSGRQGLAQHLERLAYLPIFQRGITGPDLLFEAEYAHRHGSTCIQCERSRVVVRQPRSEPDIVVHYGSIGSGNQVVKDGVTRDELSARLGGVLCFEMEAAGLMNRFQPLVIRGICDYADSHKNKMWQPFAAAAAAACATEVLSHLSALPSSTSLSSPLNYGGHLAGHVDATSGAVPRGQDIVVPNLHTMRPQRAGTNTETLSKEYLSAEQKKEYLESLNFDQSEARQATVTRAHSMTCRWLLYKAEYIDWLNDETLVLHQGFLWIKGKPATGKSTIMKYIMENVKLTQPRTVVLSFFFNARGEELERSTLGLYRSILWQLFWAFPALQDLFHTLPPRRSALRSGARLNTSNRFKGHHQGRQTFIYPTLEDTNNAFTDNQNFSDMDRPEDSMSSLKVDETLYWHVETLKALFVQAVASLGEHSVIFFVDALDECEEDEIRDMVSVFRHLGESALASGLRFRTCFSSRHYPTILMPNSIKIVLENEEGHDEDIVQYLQTELRAEGGKQIQKVRNDILARASGIFLWVVLVVQLLNKEIDRGNLHKLQKQLDEIPDGLDKLFNAILTRDNVRGLEELTICLQCVLHARRPLTPRELHHAILAVTARDEFDPSLLEDIELQIIERFLINASKGLVELTKGDQQTVQFIHESVRDFLLSKDGIDNLPIGPAKGFAVRSHEQIKLCCLEYINIILEDGLTTRQIDMQSEKIIRGHPFLPYAIENVLYHADIAAGHGKSQVVFVRTFPFAMWLVLHVRFKVKKSGKSIKFTRETPMLYVLAALDLSNLIPLEIERYRSKRASGTRHESPALVAARCGNRNALTALFATSKHPARDNVNETLRHQPLSAEERDELVRLLIGAAVKMKTQKHEKLLDWIMKADDLDGVRHRLISRLPTGFRYSIPLHEAIHIEHDGLMNLFLAYDDIIIASKDILGTQILVSALEHNRVNLVAKLLSVDETFLNIDLEQGSSPLGLASSHGHIDVVALLFEYNEVRINHMDDEGRTSLALAVRNGHNGVVKLLLEHPELQVNSADREDNTPLAIAALTGQEFTVQLLLARKDIEENTKNLQGNTPLILAAEKGNFSVAKLLTGQNAIAVNMKNNHGDSALSMAIRRQNLEICALLLGHSDIDVNSMNRLGSTPLSLAAMIGFSLSIGLLLSHAVIDVNSMDHLDRTPIMLGAEGGHVEVVKELLKHKDVDVTFRNRHGLSALAIATARRRQAIVSILNQHQAESDKTLAENLERVNLIAGYQESADSTILYNQER